MRKNLTLVLFTLCSVLFHLKGKAQINAQFLGRYSIGTYNSNGGVAEISAFDPSSKRMFVINGPDSTVKIVNIANPANPVLITTLSIKPYGIDINSIACNKKGLIAMAVVDSNGKTNASSIVFTDINGNFISKVKAGANTDHIIFTSDGNKLICANEGEPNVGYTIDPEGSISIIDLSGGAASLTQANVQTAGFTAFNSPAVIDSKIRIFGKIQSGGTFLRNSTVAEDLEPEYITISEDNSTAWVTCQENNAIAVVNINTATVTSLLPLGYKNHVLLGNGLDPSDRDNGSNGALAKIDTFPVFGLFLPDGISSFKSGSQTYLITANEGDARADWGTANVEENRVGDAAYVLDTTKFGGATGVAAIKANTALGRLTVTNRYGDFDNDGKFDSIFAFGGRSFSIWNSTTGALVWDSKDEFEQITKNTYPAYFNAGHTTNALDDRSDNKGPEPESVTIGKIKDSIYAFVALERIGGIMIYNITNPTAPYFVQYINSRNFSVTPSQANLSTVGDLGPEGIAFIPSSESPNGVNMIMLSNEVSGTVAFYTLNTPETEGITKLQDYKNNTSATIGTFQGINYKEAGFSTLFPIPNTNGTEFWTCSDRGVNIDCANANTASCRPTYDKMYAFPSYTPKIHRIRIVGDSIQILQSITIKRPNGTGATGIINPTGLGSTAAEVASTDTVQNCANFNLKTTPKDTFGIDPEGLVVDKAGNFWLCEEGGATIWQLNPNGVLIKRYTPYAHLAGKQSVDVQIDSVFKYRKNNRGFEGISIAPNGKIYAMIQSGILYPTATVGDNSRVHRILEIDPATGNQRMIVYLNDGIIGASGANQIRLSDWKIGDMAAINDSTFLVLEAAARGTSDIKRLYKININQATAVHSGLYGTNTLEGLVDSTGLAAYGIKAVSKTLVIDLLASGWPAVLDKAEGLAIINDSTIAIGNDNDFGQKSALANGIATATGNLSHVITYRISGAKKLANYKPTVLTVSSQSAYVTPAAAGVKIDPILTVGDAAENGYKMVGIPDGTGAYDNNNGTFTLLVNHELGNTVGINRAHGAKGAFVSKWVINKNDLSVVSGADLIQKVNLYTTGIGYTLYNPTDTTSKKAFARFCSADLPSVSAFYNSLTGLGTQERIFMNGEENGTEGRAFGHIATGANAGTTYELPNLGKFSWENSVASPASGDKTVVAGMDDGTDGQVYFYVGTKTNTGNEMDKAGLTNGRLYGIAVTGLAAEISATVPAPNTAFTMVDLGIVKDSTGLALNNTSNALLVTKFLRPEDGAFDPSNPNDFYFVTTNAFTAPSKMWRLRFNDIKNPTTGGTITAVLDGTEGPKMMDNIGIDKFGHIIIQEDVGNNVHIGKTWQYTIANDKLTLIASHDSTRFINGAANYLTQDEEGSGIIDVQDILGAGNFLLVDQAHYATNTEFVEGGQILKMFNPTTANAFAGASPNSSQTPYLTSAAPGVKFNSILSVGDSANNGYKMVGIPDGTGAWDNNNGTFTLLVNHELGNTVGINRAHGAKGAFVSKWVINKNDLSVVSGADLIQKVNLYTTGIGYTLYNPADTTSKKAFTRFCSADLPSVSAFYNSLTGLGTQERIFMNGEESGLEGRAFGHIATGTNAGTTYELPSLGKFSWENSVASPATGDKTVVAGMDDGTDGQVYFYVGTKTNTGNEMDKAGLTNGRLYGIAVTGLAAEISATVPAPNTAFTMVDLGIVKDSTGLALNNTSNALLVTKFLRPEDGAFDPSNPNDFYFVTTNAFTAPSKMWRLRFNDIKNPTTGGTITAVLDGTEGPKMMDNIGIDKFGHIIIQEDVGNNVHIGKTWQYTIANDKLTLIASHDSTRFINGAANYLTQDEEGSGIIDVQDILGAGNFLLVDQAHYATNTEFVEGGQILKMFNPATAIGEQLISIGSSRSINNDTVRVRGVITRAWGRFIYIQDSTGAIAVRQSSGAMVDSILSSGLKEGDFVEVVGGRGDFNNYSQINVGNGAFGENSRVTKLSTNATIPAPILVTLKQINTNGEQYESKLVRIVGLKTNSTAATFAASSNTTVWDGPNTGDSTILRVIAAQDTEVEDAPAVTVYKGSFIFEGILAQFCSSPTNGCALGYQLYGVRKKDIMETPLSAFNLLNPTNNTRINTDSANTSAIQANWNSSVNATKYKWFLTSATGSFNTPLLVVNADNAGADTLLSLTSGGLDAMLANLSVSRGDSIKTKWTVFAYKGVNDSLQATQVFNITLARNKAILGAFNLSAPANNTRLVVEEANTTAVNINWTKSTNAITYKWFLTTAAGNFVTPLLRLNANNFGADSILTITSGALDNVLNSLSIKRTDSTLLKWTVYAYLTTNDSLKASQDWNINVIRKRILSSFNLTAPANNARVEVEQNNTTPIVITWSASANATKYKWKAATLTGNFTAPLLNMDADNTGADAKLTLTSNALDVILANNGIAKGDSLNLKWTVYAYETTDSLQSAETFNVKLVRMKNVGIPTISSVENINVFPNPSNSDATLAIQLQSTEHTVVSLLDIQGKAVVNVLESDLTAGQHNVNLQTANLQNGVYFVRVTTGNKTTTIKLVVMH
ncbi:MAG: choice-of-anchor I family protein [Bacteroidota bacterium]